MPGCGTCTARSRFVSRVQIVTFKDVNIEELPQADIDLEQFRRKS